MVMQSLDVYINRLSKSMDYLVVFTVVASVLRISAKDGQRPQEAIRPKELLETASLVALGLSCSA